MHKIIWIWQFRPAQNLQKNHVTIDIEKNVKRKLLKTNKQIKIVYFKKFFFFGFLSISQMDKKITCSNGISRENCRFEPLAFCWWWWHLRFWFFFFYVIQEYMITDHKNKNKNGTIQRNNRISAKVSTLKLKK